MNLNNLRSGLGQKVGVVAAAVTLWGAELVNPGAKAADVAAPGAAAGAKRDDSELVKRCTSPGAQYKMSDSRFLESRAGTFLAAVGPRNLLETYIQRDREFLLPPGAMAQFVELGKSGALKKILGLGDKPGVVGISSPNSYNLGGQQYRAAQFVLFGQEKNPKGEQNWTWAGSVNEVYGRLAAKNATTVAQK